MLVQEEGEHVEEGEDVEDSKADEADKSTDGEIDVNVHINFYFLHMLESFYFIVEFWQPQY